MIESGFLTPRAEPFAVRTGRVAAPTAADAQAAFEALPERTRANLRDAESATDGVSDVERAWALAVDFAGPLAMPFFVLASQTVHVTVSEHLAAIVAVAVELDRGSVLSGAAVDVIMAVGESVEAGDGPPTSGSWTPITTFFAGGSEKPARIGDVLPFHDARVQAAPQLFLPSDTPPDVVNKGAIDEHRYRSISPEDDEPRRLIPGPSVVRCIRRLVGRTRDGRAAITVAPDEPRARGRVIRPSLAELLRAVGRLTIRETTQGEPSVPALRARPRVRFPVASSMQEPRSQRRSGFLLIGELARFRGK